MYPPNYRAGAQRVIVYTDPRDGVEHVYDTSYDDDQAADVLLECHARYGTAVKPRSVYAKQYFKEPAVDHDADQA